MDLDTYLPYHRLRFDYIDALAKRLKPEPSSRVLDVGPGPMTQRLRAHYREVWSLGFERSTIFGDSAERERHIVFDLNRCNDRSAWVDTPLFDLIVFSEVIEHVVVDHCAVLRFFAHALNDDGLILCTTPNLAAFHKRLRGLVGLTPWHRWESGHITEFSKRDLIKIGRQADLKAVHHAFANYFGVVGSPARRAVIRTVDG